ncbi:MAG: bacterial transcriptional activator domain-containing protein, partial [Nitrospirota bacterium]|nr:bacterial transcriptional activator domain-containing protein [Nitrospirota bacterium]
MNVHMCIRGLHVLKCVGIFVLAIGGVFPVHSWAKVSQSTGLEKVQAAFDKGDFKQVVELVEPLLQEANPSPQMYRLHILALARMGNSPGAMDSYEKLVQSTKREDESLLRQLALAVILSKQADMRE